MRLFINDLHKTYPNGTKALDGVNLAMPTGMFGLLGPNGAGKSSLMRTIATLQQPDRGSIQFDEVDTLAEPMVLRHRLGYLPQEFGVYPKQSAERLLDFFAQLKGIHSKKDRRRIIDYCLDVTNLSQHRKQHVSGYSGGMRQRFGIAQMLLNDPQLIIVDEPTAGLDPAERNRFLNILREISNEAVVIFSTHIVEDISDLCANLAIMQGGRVLLQNTPEAAVAQLRGQVYTVEVAPEEAFAFRQNHSVLAERYTRTGKLRLRIKAAVAPPSSTPVEATLEDLYFTVLNTMVVTPNA